VYFEPPDGSRTIPRSPDIAHAAGLERSIVVREYLLTTRDHLNIAKTDMARQIKTHSSDADRENELWLVVMP